MDIQVILNVMIKLFLLMSLGYGLAKINIIDSHTNSKISAMISKVTCPCLVMSSVLTSSTENRISVVYLLLAGFVMYVSFIVFGKIVSLIPIFPKKYRPLYELMFVFSNNAFMGYPVIQSILGTEAVFVTAMIHFSFNILIFSYGLINIDKCKDGAGDNTKFQFKRLLNPGFILTLCAVVVYIVGFRSQGVIYSTISMVGNLTTPLSMMVIGASLAGFSLIDSIKHPRTYFFSAIRLLVMPVITFFICKFIGINDYYTTIVTITNGMPVASLVLMLGNEARIDTSEIIKSIFVSTVLSTISVPLVVALLF